MQRCLEQFCPREKHQQIFFLPHSRDTFYTRAEARTERATELAQIALFIPHVQHVTHCRVIVTSRLISLILQLYTRGFNSEFDLTIADAMFNASIE